MHLKEVNVHLNFIKVTENERLVFAQSRVKEIILMITIIKLTISYLGKVLSLVGLNIKTKADIENLTKTAHARH